jgi:hypothetical protein
MKHIGWWLAALPLVSGCGSAIAPNQADGSDCNFSVLETACGATSYCDPGVADAKGVYPRVKTFGLTGDKSHVVGTCRAKLAVGGACLGNGQCASGKCTHASAAPGLGAKGACE